MPSAFAEHVARRAAVTLPYAAPGVDGVELPESYGAYEAEYAALRRHVGVVAWPQRALLQIAGDDRLDFLGRMLSQHVAALPGGSSVRSFQLDDKGRIVADLVVHHGDRSTWLDTDVASLTPLHELLDRRLFAEDVTLEDVTPQWACVSLVGPAAVKLATEVETADALADDAPSASTVEAMAAAAGTHHVVLLAGVRCTAYRWTQAGEAAVVVWAPAERAVPLYDALLDAAGYVDESSLGEADEADAAAFAAQRRAGLRGRPVGWSAYNTARVEAGEPLHHIDFGPDSLPHELGPRTLDQAVSLTKGCWLGQEAVARMQNLGHPKKVLTGLRMSEDALPAAGAEIRTDRETARPVGVVTSSTLSPLHGRAPIALAVMKWNKHKPGTTVAVAAEGRWADAELCEPGWLP